jgi:glucose/arabinose dehydrogenase
MNRRSDWPLRRTALHAWVLLGSLAACGGDDATGPAMPAAGPLTITQPAAFAAGLAGVVTVQATSADPTIASVEFQIDGTPIATDATAPYAVTVDSNAFASGQHVLRVRAIDAAGSSSAWTGAIVQFGGSRTQPAGFTRNFNHVTGLSAATAIAQLPDGRLLITEQGGTLRVWNGSSLATMLTLAVDSQGERGLLGVTPHPNFVSNGFIYVYYTTTSGGTHNRVSRFTVSGNTAGSEVQIVNLPALSSATNHNGGALQFGPDGKLYVAVGENANPANAQNLNTPLGKMLRFNDDGTIPADNPICITTGDLACAVWAYGLRNPFTFAFQPGTGRMHINDVGQSTWEEIDVGAAGANYGWPTSEGPDNIGNGITGPLFAYRHGAPVPSGPGGFFTGIAIVGGAFYPDSGMFPAPWRSGYFFSDLGSGFVGFIDLLNDNAAYAFGSVPGAPVGMLVANDGALLVVTQTNVVRFSTP